jgi:hypothetical protein
MFKGAKKIELRKCDEPDGLNTKILKASIGYIFASNTRTDMSMKTNS